MNKSTSMLLSRIPVVILAGGQGAAIGSSVVLPKPMVEVGDEPILYHIIKHYERAGFKRFIICAGYGIERIDDAVSRLKRGQPRTSITVVNTGIKNMTGSRLFQVREMIMRSPLFCMTYGDTVSDIDLQRLVSFHREHKKIATLAAVHAPTRFRILGLYGDDDVIRGFSEKPVLEKDYINGGFYVFNRAVFNLSALNSDEDCVLETSVLECLASKNELFAFKHTGFWQYVDSERDRQKVSLWLSRKGT